MKTKIMTILLAAMLTMTGCELRNTVTDDPAETANTQETEAAAEQTGNTENTENTEETEESSVDYTAYYLPVIDQLFSVVSGNYDENNIPAGVIALLEGGDMLWNAGYSVSDVSGDGIPELLIGDRNSGMIYALYTVKDGQVHLTLEGAYRNAYYLMDDGALFNRGSAGAAYSIFGLYDLSADGTVLNCRDCWFTYEKDGNFEDVRGWHNTTGEMDTAVSEELAMTLDELWAKEAELFDRIIVPELTAFGVYGGLEKPVYAENPTITVLYDHEYTGKYDEYTADDSEYAAKVVFTTDGAVRDFKVIALTVTDVSEDGNISFMFNDLYVCGDLIPEKGLAVKMSLPETVPFYGISYTDGNGETRIFSVNLSGFDGSVYLAEIGGVG